MVVKKKNAKNYSQQIFFCQLEQKKFKEYKKFQSKKYHCCTRCHNSKFYCYLKSEECKNITYIKCFKHIYYDTVVPFSNSQPWCHFSLQFFIFRVGYIYIMIYIYIYIYIYYYTYIIILLYLSVTASLDAALPSSSSFLGLGICLWERKKSLGN